MFGPGVQKCEHFSEHNCVSWSYSSETLSSLPTQLTMPELSSSTFGVVEKTDAQTTNTLFSPS